MLSTSSGVLDERSLATLWSRSPLIENVLVVYHHWGERSRRKRFDDGRRSTSRKSCEHVANLRRELSAPVRGRQPACEPFRRGSGLADGYHYRSWMFHIYEGA